MAGLRSNAEFAAKCCREGIVAARVEAYDRRVQGHAGNGMEQLEGRLPPGDGPEERLKIDVSSDRACREVYDLIDRDAS